MAASLKDIEKAQQYATAYAQKHEEAEGLDDYDLGGSLGSSTGSASTTGTSAGKRGGGASKKGNGIGGPLHPPSSQKGALSPALFRSAGGVFLPGKWSQATLSQWAMGLHAPSFPGPAHLPSFSSASSRPAIEAPRPPSPSASASPPPEDSPVGFTSFQNGSFDLLPSQALEALLLDEERGEEGGGEKEKAGSESPSGRARRRPRSAGDGVGREGEKEDLPCPFCADKVFVRFVDMLTYPRPVRKFSMLLPKRMRIGALREMLWREVGLEKEALLEVRIRNRRLTAGQGDAGGGEEDTLEAVGVRDGVQVVVSKVLGGDGEEGDKAGVNAKNKQFVGDLLFGQTGKGEGNEGAEEERGEGGGGGGGTSTGAGGSASASRARSTVKGKGGRGPGKKATAKEKAAAAEREKEQALREKREREEEGQPLSVIEAFRISGGYQVLGQTMERLVRERVRARWLGEVKARQHERDLLAALEAEEMGAEGESGKRRGKKNKKKEKERKKKQEEAAKKREAALEKEREAAARQKALQEKVEADRRARLEQQRREAEEEKKKLEAALEVRRLEEEAKRRRALEEERERQQRGSDERQRLRHQPPQSLPKQAPQPQRQQGCKPVPHQQLRHPSSQPPRPLSSTSLAAGKQSPQQHPSGFGGAVSRSKKPLPGPHPHAQAAGARQGVSPAPAHRGPPRSPPTTSMRHAGPHSHRPAGSHQGMPTYPNHQTKHAQPPQLPYRQAPGGIPSSRPANSPAAAYAHTGPPSPHLPYQSAVVSPSSPSKPLAGGASKPPSPPGISLTPGVSAPAGGPSPLRPPHHRATASLGSPSTLSPRQASLPFDLPHPAPPLAGAKLRALGPAEGGGMPASPDTVTLTPRFCSQCGSQLQGHAPKFCSQCGAGVGRSVGTAQDGAATALSAVSSPSSPLPAPFQWDTLPSHPVTGGRGALPPPSRGGEAGKSSSLPRSAPSTPRQYASALPPPDHPPSYMHLVRPASGPMSPQQEQARAPPALQDGRGQRGGREGGVEDSDGRGEETGRVGGGEGEEGGARGLYEEKSGSLGTLSPVREGARGEVSAAGSPASLSSPSATGKIRGQAKLPGPARPVVEDRNGEISSGLPFFQRLRIG